MPAVLVQLLGEQVHFVVLHINHTRGNCTVRAEIVGADLVRGAEQAAPSGGRLGALALERPVVGTAAADAADASAEVRDANRQRSRRSAGAIYRRRCRIFRAGRSAQCPARLSAPVALEIPRALIELKLDQANGVTPELFLDDWCWRSGRDGTLRTGLFTPSFAGRTKIKLLFKTKNRLGKEWHYL